METIKKTLTQVRDIWDRSGRGNRIAMVALVLFSLAAITGVGIWSSQPQYIPLAVGLTPDETAKIVSLIETEGISYQLNHAGSSVSVPKTDWAAARVAVGDAIPNVNAAPNLDPGNPLDSTETLRNLEHRNREIELGAAIQRMHAIQTAQVKISKPRNEIFQRPEEGTRASVLLDVKQGHFFSHQNAEAIALHIAHSVEGVTADNVSVTSMRGEDLRGTGSGIPSDIQSQLDYQKRVEAYYGSKVHTFLAASLGAHKAIVEVTTALDFEKQEITSKTYDPDGKVAKSEDILSDSQSGQVEGGLVGAAGNFGSNNALLRGGTQKKETAKSEFLVPETTETITKQPGKLLRLNVGVIVDLAGDTDGADADTDAAATPSRKKLTVAEVEKLVTTCLGIDESRGDQISVVEGPVHNPFAGDAVPVAGAWDQYRDMFQVVSLGLASLVAVVFGLLTLRRLKPITLPPDTSEAESKRDKLVEEISEEATSHPETISQIVATWLNEPLPTPEPTSGEEVPAADAGDAEPPANEIRAAA